MGLEQREGSDDCRKTAEMEIPTPERNVTSIWRILKDRTYLGKYTAGKKTRPEKWLK